MTTYCIGDVHGCYNELCALLDKINFNKDSDNLIFTGDLIGRGPEPSKTLDFILSLKDKATTVLGNHDLHFLACAYNLIKPKEKDNLNEVLQSKKLKSYIDFYLSKSFLYVDKSKTLAVVHAGLYPLWSFKECKAYAKILDDVFHDSLTREMLLLNMYSQEIKSKMPSVDGLPLWRFLVNAFTRMRLSSKHGCLDYKLSSIDPNDALALDLYPWFDLGHVGRGKNKQYTVVFGHWAALNGKCKKEHIIALDTGCVWGGKLSCYNVNENKLISVKSKGYLDIKA